MSSSCSLFCASRIASLCLFKFSYYSNVVKKKEGGYLATDHTLMCFFPLTVLIVTMNGPCMCPCSRCSLWSLNRNFVHGRPCLSVNILFAITVGSVDFVIAVDLVVRETFPARTCIGGMFLGGIGTRIYTQKI